MTRQDKPIRTDIGWSDASSITIFGKDFPSEILGHLNLGDMGFMELTGRVPNAQESRMFNAMVVTLVGLTIGRRVVDEVDEAPAKVAVGS